MVASVLTNIEESVHDRDAHVFTRLACYNQNTKRAGIYAAVNASWAEGIEICRKNFDRDVWTLALINGSTYNRCRADWILVACPDAFRNHCLEEFKKNKGLIRRIEGKRLLRQHVDGDLDPEAESSAFT